MKLQKTIPLEDIYNREEDFSVDLAENLEALGIGKFEDAETEAKVGTRKADIVATGADGALVIENQFGKADWDHWGRLEAYARLKEATVAVLVAENFEELMIVTCRLRDEDSNIDWYLIQAQANSHEELSFHHVVGPAIDIQTEKKTEGGYSEFWQPIRDGNGVFAGKPVPVRDETWIMKTTRKVQVCLYLNNHLCYIRLFFLSPNHFERRDKIMALFPEPDYDYEYKDTSTLTTVIFRVLDKGKKDQDDWDEIREKLVSMGTDIYNKISESNL
ncbi:hypothetical protein C6496_02440 [Candidatus Poribacteria bacterium]|nr:MAG: hypothetical protein C6496_02440 [Candidatus Poribacteria bacterium]